VKFHFQKTKKITNIFSDDSFLPFSFSLFLKILVYLSSFALPSTSLELTTKNLLNGQSSSLTLHQHDKDDNTLAPPFCGLV